MTNKMTTRIPRLAPLLVASALASSMSACATDDEPQQTAAQSGGSRVLWVCYTIATCNGHDELQTHDVCVDPSPHDYYLAGDRAAADWSLFWDAACTSYQGNVETDGAARLCVDSHGDPASWGCRALCEPAYLKCP